MLIGYHLSRGCSRSHVHILRFSVVRKPSIRKGFMNQSSASTRKRPSDSADESGQLQRQRRSESYEGVSRLDAPPVALLKVRGLPSWANVGFLGLSFRDVVLPNVRMAIVSSYYIDVEWLLEAVPALQCAEHLTFLHGHQGTAAASLLLQLAALDLAKKSTVFSPKVPPFGTHHSKFFILQYDRGLRVVIHTANLIYIDCNNKTQGAYVQDFPRKDAESPSSSPFEDDLKTYFRNLHMPQTSLQRILSVLSLHDFSHARVHLIASVPGSHTQQNLRLWGRLRLRELLQKTDFMDESFVDSSVVINHSSTGSFNEKWLKEFKESLSAGSSPEANAGKQDNALDDLNIVWPTVEEVRNSLEGWSAGGSIHGNPEKMRQPFLSSLFCHWKADVTGRQRAMPHLKSYARFRSIQSSFAEAKNPRESASSASGDEKANAHDSKNTLAYLCISSHNLSKAAWGQQQRHAAHGTQLRILSYELGIVLTPQTELSYRRSRWYGFSLEGNGGEGRPGPMAGITDNTKVQLVQWRRGESQDAYLDERKDVIVVPLPLPYDLPPSRYDVGAGDVAWDKRTEGFPGLDIYGLSHPGEAVVFVDDPLP